MCPTVESAPCGVGAILYDYVLAYDKDKLKDGPEEAGPTSSTPRSVRASAPCEGPKATIEIALMADGVAPKDVYKVLATDEGIDRAFKKLDTIKERHRLVEGRRAAAAAARLRRSGDGTA